MSGERLLGLEITVENVTLVVQAIATIGILLTLIVYAKQLSVMQRQLKASENAAADQLSVMQEQLKASESAAVGQNLLTLANFLQDETVRDAREIVIKTLCSKSRFEWTEEEERAAAKVCSTYDLASQIIRQGLVPLEAIAENWGPSIKKCYEILEPYIQEMQKPEKGGPAYWDDFGWLYEKVVK